MPRILITGGAGFIGSHIADRCTETGWEVHILDNMSLGDRANIPKSAVLFAMDIRDAGVETLFRENRYQYLCHQAGQVNVRESVADPFNDVDVNVLGSIRLFEWSVKYDVRHVVYASTGGAVYGEQVAFPADENHPTNPDSPYGIDKLTAEKYLHYFHKAHGLSYTTLRYTNVYGPRQNPAGEAGVIAIFIDNLLTRGEAVINGDGKQTRDYVYVGDVARANVLALEKRPSGPVNICTGTETDVNTLYELIADVMKIDALPAYGPAKKGEQLRSVCSNDTAQRLLQWEPRTGLAEGIRLTNEFFKSKFQGG